MISDGFVLKRIVDELSSLEGAKLRQIYQYGKSDIYLYFQNAVVRICLEPSLAHICYTEKEDFSDHRPSNFVLLLRTKLRNARVRKVCQVSLDRVMFFEFDKIDEIGNRHFYRLYIEFFGSHCNVIFVENDIIIDALRSVLTVSRRIQKGEIYRSSNEKLNPLEVTYSDFSFDERAKISQVLSQEFFGFSKYIIRELLNRANLQDKLACDLLTEERESLKHSFFSLINDFERGKTYVYEFEEKFLITTIPLKTLPFKNLSEHSNISNAIDDIYKIVLLKKEVDNFKARLIKCVQDKVKKSEKILNTLEEELLACRKAEEYHKYGELLKYAQEKKDLHKSVNVMDYNTGQMTLVPLVDGKGVKESSQYYFALYKKLKEKSEILKTRIKRETLFLNYAEQLMHTLELAEDLETLQEIEQEMAQQGLIKEKTVFRKSKSKPEFKKIVYEGFTILVGKNNKQNEKLVRISNKNDIWLHVHEMPGAHVVIKTNGQTVPRKILEFAAAIAAYHSKARFSSKVPVDYTPIKNVHKPKGSPPGMVLYTNYETIFANPNLLKTSGSYPF